MKIGNQSEVLSTSGSCQAFHWKSQTGKKIEWLKKQKRNMFITLSLDCFKKNNKSALPRYYKLPLLATMSTKQVCWIIIPTSWPLSSWRLLEPSRHGVGNTWQWWETWDVRALSGGYFRPGTHGGHLDLTLAGRDEMSLLNSKNAIIIQSLSHMYPFGHALGGFLK